MSFLYSKWLNRRSSQYQAPPEQSEADESQRLKADDDYNDHRISQCQCEKGQRLPAIHRVCVIVIVVANILMFISSTTLLSTRKRAMCSEKQSSAYSPIFDRLDIHRSPVHFNDTFWPDDPPSIFQQRPSPEVDKAWHRLSSLESIGLSVDEVRRLGYDPATVWRAPKDQFGEGVYYGHINVFHQIHCLDLLRSTAWPAYYGDLREKAKDIPLGWDDHLLHCQFILLRALLCHADIEVTVFQKFKGWPGINANFASTKMCRNFKDILEWKEANELKTKGEWTEYPDHPIVEVDPEGVLTPYGNHDGLKEWMAREGKPINSAILGHIHK
ncbi:uncharacterized protein GIQ15_03714 [Arthroderma uncinatum]|uniref:uncharacterized protein n=1 Tax=Arthroderma uncinatum TaxID=74035 RepID=UPI00144AB6B2|nr:uncharacterized protein GIQ15_03714 [Arthroderma uncinatum]KAF3484390.1 hypothetical protein GIQ15_03714 [Arthroderma uncinatum]